MKRRDFLRTTPAAALALMISGLPVRALAGNRLLHMLQQQTIANGRVIVLVQLTGGNDGLNTIIPLDQYSTLSAARANILIPENKVLSLSRSLSTGMHPAMSGIRNMYNNGLVNIVQGVSYPEPDFSHFRATDIWLTGSDAAQYLNDGWLGRYLAAAYPGFPQGYPDAASPDPLAIQIGAAVSTALIGPAQSMGMAITDVDSFYNMVNNQVTPAPATPAGHELTFLRNVAQQTQQYTGVLQAAAGKGKNLSVSYPSGNPLADQLKIVARLISGGLQTPVYVVSLGNFDFHVGQVDPSDHTVGSHAALLTQLSEAITAFFDDCKLLQIDEKVAAMTFSEFGRRIISNGGQGTDHGTAEPVMVFGSKVNPGFIGSNPVIPQNATDQDNLDMQFDYRSVYAAVLADWFGLPPEVTNAALLRDFDVLPIFRKDNGGLLTSGPNSALAQNWPNPFSRSTTISFASEGGWVTIILLDDTGRPVRTVASQQYDKGVYELTIYRDRLPSGNYFCKLINGAGGGTIRMTIAGN